MARVMPRTRSGRFIKLLGDGKALLLDKEDSLDGVEVTLWRKGDEERAKETKSLTPEVVRQKFDFTPAERADYNEKVRASENDPLALQQGFGDMSKLALGVYNQNKNFQALMCSGQGPNRDETKVEFCRVEPKPESESDLLEEGAGFKGGAV